MAALAAKARASARAELRGEIGPDGVHAPVFMQRRRPALLPKGADGEVHSRT
jgi:hypothetical protein